MKINVEYVKAALVSVSEASETFGVTEGTITRHLEAWNKLSEDEQKALEAAPAVAEQKKVAPKIERPDIKSIVTHEKITYATGKQAKAQAFLAEQIKEKGLTAQQVIDFAKADKKTDEGKEQFEQFVELRNALQAHCEMPDKATGLAKNYVLLSAERLVHNIPTKEQLTANA